MDKTKFNKELDGKRIALYELANAHGMTVHITNYGAKIVSVNVPDRNGRMADVVLGFDNIDDYLAKEPFFGAICGRFANRIKNGTFTLDGTTYQLAVNNGPNHLHGGIRGFNVQVWDVVESTPAKLALHYLSADGEEHYPGNLDVTVTYTLTDEGELRIHYEATTDQPTVLGMCNHSYFHLTGAGEGTIRDHYLQIEADFHTVLDDSGQQLGRAQALSPRTGLGRHALRTRQRAQVAGIHYAAGRANLLGQLGGTARGQGRQTLRRAIRHLPRGAGIPQFAQRGALPLGGAAPRRKVRRMVRVPLLGGIGQGSKTAEPWNCRAARAGVHPAFAAFAFLCPRANLQSEI